MCWLVGLLSSCGAHLQLEEGREREWRDGGREEGGIFNTSVHMARLNPTYNRQYNASNPDNRGNSERHTQALD